MKMLKLTVFIFLALMPWSFALAYTVSSQTDSDTRISVSPNSYNLLGTGISGNVERIWMYWSYQGTNPTTVDVTLECYTNASYTTPCNSETINFDSASITSNQKHVTVFTRTTGQPSSMSATRYWRLAWNNSHTAYQYGNGSLAYYLITNSEADPNTRIVSVTSPLPFVVNGSDGAVTFEYNYNVATTSDMYACIYLSNLTARTDPEENCVAVTALGAGTYSQKLNINDDTAYSWRAVLKTQLGEVLATSRLFHYTTGASWTTLIGAPIDLNVSSSSLSSQDLLFPLEQSESYCATQFPYNDSDVVQATVTYLPNALCRIITWTSTVPEELGVSMSSFAVTLMSVPPFSFIEQLHGEIEAL